MNNTIWGRGLEPLLTIQTAFDDEDRCELLQDDQGAKCPNRATRKVSENWTPAGFTMRVCDECAKNQMEMGYIDGGRL